MARIKLTSRELQSLVSGNSPTFPKYATQILNLANGNAQGTRPAVVGQMSELIQQFPGRTLDEWQQWYLAQHPYAISKATERIYQMVQQLRAALEQIDRDMVESWVQDLVLVKTYAGLRFQHAILRFLAERKQLPHRLATPEEEARGIDGYLGEIPVSIKPNTYQAMPQLPENIAVRIIYYTKAPDGVEIEFDL